MVLTSDEPQSLHTVSVALCTRNGARFIGMQLGSIFAQTRLPDEIVISDDDSSDGTREATLAALDSFRLENPEARIEVRILRNAPALGVVKNFESTVSACTGELIVLSDQDDLWRPDRIERALAEFEADPELLLVNSDADLVDENGLRLGATLFQALEVTSQELHDIREDRAYEQLLRRNLVTGATTMFRRELLSAARPFPDPWVHDEWLAIVAAAIGRIRCIEDQLIQYRQHATNAIGAHRPTLRDKIDRLRHSRFERNERLRTRAETLVAHLLTLQGLPRSVLTLARLKRDHEAMRSSLPALRILRLRPVLAAVRRGSYRQFSRGRRDVLRDLIQPA